jgi:hypothetical protein
VVDARRSPTPPSLPATHLRSQVDPHAVVARVRGSHRANERGFDRVLSRGEFGDRPPF